MNRELLLVDYDKSLAAVDKFDGALFQNPQLVSRHVWCGDGVRIRPALRIDPLLASLLAVLFGLFALVFKTFQIDAVGSGSPCRVRVSGFLGRLSRCSGPARGKHAQLSSRANGKRVAQCGLLAST